MHELATAAPIRVWLENLVEKNWKLQSIEYFLVKKQKASRSPPFDLKKDFVPLMGLLTGGPRFLSG